MLSFLFLRHLSDNCETAAKTELRHTTPMWVRIILPHGVLFRENAIRTATKKHDGFLKEPELPPPP
jgi:hypothetical protein